MSDKPSPEAIRLAEKTLEELLETLPPLLRPTMPIEDSLSLDIIARALDAFAMVRVSDARAHERAIYDTARRALNAKSAAFRKAIEAVVRSADRFEKNDYTKADLDLAVQRERERCLQILDLFRNRHGTTCDCTPMDVVSFVGAHIERAK